MLSQLSISFSTHAGRNAFCINDTYYTYEDLLKITYRIQSILQRHGDSRTRRVGIVTTNSIETYASILACWFSGCAYVPLHPTNPPERNKTIIGEAKIDRILGPGAKYEDFSGEEKSFTFLPTDTAEDAEKGPSAPLAAAGLNDDDLLYILFTSGSTGTPKGVPITYGNVKTFIDSFQALGFKYDGSDRFLQMFDLAFDVSVACYIIPLLTGACVYTVPTEGIKYTQVFKVLQKHQISFASIVPSIINYLRPYFSEIRLPSLKYCILTAEASNLEVVKEWARCMPDGQIVNLYGPTEATIWCTGYRFDGAKPKGYNEMLIIGKPFKNIEILILDEDGNEVVKGEKGELCVTGGQVTPGYVNNEERNKTAFFTRDGKRYYKTGDLCYLDDENDIFYCGRADHQVKIQGFRIELSEIEVTVRKTFSLNTAAVVFKNTLGVQQIGLFLENYNGEIIEVKNALEKKLPYYMIPSAIRSIENLPYNTSGKVDRVSLTRMFE
jgi:D-alanine--poly(phosphoribitol) ligase subunit 1